MPSNVVEEITGEIICVSDALSWYDHGNMASQRQHLTGTQQTSTPHLDGYLKGIRDEFDRLNHELDETRKQRDEYMTKYKSQIEELRELRQAISRREERIVCQHGQDIAHADDNPSPLISLIPSSEDAASDRLHDPENDKVTVHLDGESNQESGQNETLVAPTITGAASLSLQANVAPVNEPGYSAWVVEFSGDTTAALNLNLVYKLIQKWRTRVTFSMDGKYLASASSSGVVSIFDSKTGKRISVMKDLYCDEKSQPAYRCISFSPDGKYLATGSDDGKVRIWIVSQRRIRNIFKHQHDVSTLNFSPNGQWIASGSWDMTVRIWRLRDGSSRVLLSASKFSPWSIRFSRDGRHIASGFDGILIWNVRTGELVAKWQGSDGAQSLAFTPDGKGLLSASSRDNIVIHWDVALLGSLGICDPPSSSMVEISRLVGHTDYIHSVSVSPDAKWIASGSWDNTVRIWNVHDATLHCILHSPGNVWSVDFSPDGNYLAIGGDFEGDFEVTIWNYASL